MSLNEKDEEDLKKLRKLYQEIVGLKFNNKDLTFLQVHITSAINTETTKMAKENNISYDEYEKIEELARKSRREDEQMKILGEAKLDDIFENNSIKGIVETLQQFGYTSEEIKDTFADEEDMEKADKILSDIQEKSNEEEEI